MTILAFHGFDTFGGAFKGGANSDQNDPINVGILNTPMSDTFSLTYGGSWPDPSNSNFQSNNGGVTGLEKHKIGAGDERRNTLIFQAGRTTNSVSKTTLGIVSTLTTTPTVNPGRPFGFRFGFYLTDFTEFPASPATHPSILDLMLGSNITSIIQRSVVGGVAYWNIANVPTAQHPRVVRGEPIHVEIELSGNPPMTATTFYLTLKVWINGDLVATSQPWSMTGGPTMGAMLVRPRFVAQAVAVAYMNCFGLSDYVASTIDDGVNPVPNLGPMMVLTGKVESFDGPEWTVVGGSASTVLTDADAATYVLSPASKPPMSVKVDLGLPVGADVKGLNVYVRSARDVPASAAMSYTTTTLRTIDGKQLGVSPALPVSGTPTFHKPLGLLGNDAAGIEALQFADSGKLTLNFNMS